MPFDAVTIGAVAGGIVTVAIPLGAAVKWVYDKLNERLTDAKTDFKERLTEIREDRKNLISKLDECQGKHTDDRELIGGLQATIGMLAKAQGGEVQRQVERKLETVSAKVQLGQETRVEAAKQSEGTR